MEASQTHFQWSSRKRMIFRFVFIYLILYNFPFPLDFIPFIGEKYSEFWHIIVPWVGKHLLHLSYDITVFTNGSGDTTYDYVLVLCYLILTGVGILIWSLFNRKKQTNFETLHHWLRVYVRASLAVAMLSYGTVKVIQTQFPPPGLSRLVQPFGDASPMGLLWTFMGASKGYNMFTGMAEMLGGLLVLSSRRTVTLGALICIGVMSNVVMLNLCYDVPVKLYSSHLLLMAVFLAAPEFKRLANLFLFNRKVEPVELVSLFARRRFNQAALVLRTLSVVLLIGYFGYSAYHEQYIFGEFAPKPPFYGLWAVEEFEVNGEVRPPLLSDGTRWRRIVFDYNDRLSIQLVSDTLQRFTFKLDAEKKHLTLGKRTEPNWKTDFTCQQLEPNLILLEGTLENQHIRARLHQTEIPTFYLTNRGFHWINEYPFNR